MKATRNCIRFPTPRVEAPWILVASLASIPLMAPDECSGLSCQLTDFLRIALNAFFLKSVVMKVPRYWKRNWTRKALMKAVAAKTMKSPMMRSLVLKSSLMSAIMIWLRRSAMKGNREPYTNISTNNSQNHFFLFLRTKSTRFTILHRGYLRSGFSFSFSFFKATS